MVKFQGRSILDKPESGVQLEPITMVKGTKNSASSELDHVPDVRTIQTYKKQMYKENSVTGCQQKPKVLRRERTSDIYNICEKRLRIMES